MGSSASTSRRSGARGPSRWDWPTTSSSDRGRMRTASGAPGSTPETSGAGSSNSDTPPPIRSRGALRSSLVPRCDAHAPVRSGVRTLPAGHDSPVQQRRIGDQTVSAIGLGAMPLSTKQDRPTGEAAEAVVHAALDAGVTLIDTADAYALDESEFGHNEELVARALASYGGDTSDVLVATKGGHTRRGTDWELDGTRAHLRRGGGGAPRRAGGRAGGPYPLPPPPP